MKKRIMTILSAAILAVALTACGSSVDTSKTSTSTQNLSLLHPLSKAPALFKQKILPPLLWMPSPAKREMPQILQQMTKFLKHIHT